MTSRRLATAAPHFAAARTVVSTNRASSTWASKYRAPPRSPSGARPGSRHITSRALSIWCRSMFRNSDRASYSHIPASSLRRPTLPSR